MIAIYLEPEEQMAGQTSGALPQLNQGKGGKKVGKSGKRGC